MRLAFSLAINIDPDILIIDEVLAVGDIKFRKKSYEKIKKFKQEGKTILICTHSLSVVSEICTKAIWIHKGKLMKTGEPKEIIKEYNDFMISAKNNTH